MKISNILDENSKKGLVQKSYHLDLEMDQGKFPKLQRNRTMAGPKMGEFVRRRINLDKYFNEETLGKERRDSVIRKGSKLQNLSLKRKMNLALEERTKRRSIRERLRPNSFILFPDDLIKKLWDGLIVL